MRVGAAAIIPVMLGAIFMVHWGQWHFMATETHPMGGMQFQVTLLLILSYLALKGNGVNSAGIAREEMVMSFGPGIHSSCSAIAAIN